MATSLPNNPSLQRFRRDARRLQRAVRNGDERARDLVARLHPHGMPGDPVGLPLSAAQLVVARCYGFSSWPRLKLYLDVAAPLRRDPSQITARDAADRFCALGCLTYTDADDPARWAEAETSLQAEPDLPLRSVSAAAVAGDPDAIRGHLVSDPRSATRKDGPLGWPPLL